ncbi:MAG TPA: flavodoxin family protein [Euryarchaeota archaeon]|nr:flavodoxin family protein [Euryarchaeota archaeon]
MTKVLAVNSSPNMEEGTTALILNPFLEGMKDAGAEVELLYTKKLDIKPCIGDFSCWETGGKCCINDDMEQVVSKLLNADMWIFGIPVYIPFPGEFQNLLNRTMPLFDGSADVRGGRMYPRLRKEVKLKLIGLISTCGYWGLDNFDKVIDPIKDMAEICKADFPDPLLRPHASLLMSMLNEGSDVGFIVDAAREAGSQIINDGKISPKTSEIVSRPLVSFEEFASKESP